MAFRADFYLMVGVYSLEGLPGSSVVKNLPAMQETWVQSLGWEDSPAGGNSNPLQYSCLENPMDGRAGGVQSGGKSWTELN